MLEPRWRRRRRRHLPLRRILLFWAALAAGCGTPAAEPLAVPEVIALPPWDGPFETALATDLDPADDVVEVELTAQPTDVEVAQGRKVSLWTYNGVLPGPRIEAKVGDTLRVKLTNQLPDATTIHWHGLRVPNAMDGVAMIQSPVAPGATFTYEFELPDAGTFWYHPHLEADQQVERGLYGAIVVRGASEPATATDRVVVLDDLLVDTTTWQLAAFDGMTQAMPGRQGNLILANGRAHPIADVQPGGLHRFRFINAANARYFRLALPGATLTQIGTDGGLLEAGQPSTEILLVPGERADLLITADGAAGSTQEWQTLAYDRGHGTGGLPDAGAFQMRHTNEARLSPAPLPTALGTVASLPAASITRSFELEEGAAGSTSGGGHAGHGGASSTEPTFSINGKIYPDKELVEATLGDVEEWSIVNDTEMDHPFHLHGFRFQIVDAQGQAPAFRAWRDTVNVPAEETLRVRMQLEENPGTWMYHCHILEHAERGMAGELRVVAP